MKNYLILFLILLLFGCAKSPNLGRHFGENTGCFVLFDVHNNEFVKFNEKRCAERFSPCSTFKIPNSIIALETGLFDDVDSVVVWDSVNVPRQDWWPEKWAGDQSIRTGMKYSVVWFYQLIARQVGKERYSTFLERMNYGNQDISSPVYRFWLTASLKISADEQIDYLKKFYFNDFNFSDESVEMVKDIMLLEESDNYKFYGKTGGGNIDENNFIGWLVGFVEKDDDLFFYAMNVEGKSFKEVADKRIIISKNILNSLGVL